ncbi:hypothetical protein PTTG_07632 [Puccinia triticina 1-1 BBBD Race 1]|uniref:Uncharacterized protein n=1 Tax=Puccinia triticina (isolate 1-1 / race 1 (BBBD)) TaxID=630390 RepID=A0A180GXZ9_PUCT1|nr:hypothetical protein PTTG_07632 [Puccinia triticina 1-1 BBBD Race 1]
MRSDRSRLGSAITLRHRESLQVPQLPTDAPIRQTLQHTPALLPTDRQGSSSLSNTRASDDRQKLKSSKHQSQPVIPRAQSVGLDATRPASRHSKRTRRDATFNSNLLIKAYLKNPVNPVPFPSLLMKTGRGMTGPASQGSSSAGGTLTTPKPSRAGMNGSERSSPPRLNGPFLRIRSDDDYDSRRVDSLFYGPVDPVLVDPSVDHYYTFPALEEALMAPLNCYECDLFDPVILHPSFNPLRPSNHPVLSTPPSQPSQFSAHSLVNLNSEIFPWDAKKGIGLLNPC